MQGVEYFSVRPDLPDPISNINVMTVEPMFEKAAHSHSYYHINRIMSGSLTVETDEGCYKVDAGCTMVLPPNHPHALKSAGGYTQIGVDVECLPDSRGIFSEIQLIQGDFLMKRIPMTSYVAQESVDRMLHLICNPTKGNIMRALHLAEGQILDLLEALRHEADDGFLEQFTSMLSQYEPWNLSLADMCRILCLSRTQLERKAKLTFGCGASEYCARLRYSMVCNLLKRDMTLEEIASETGFYDACHLSKFFMGRCGITPGQYRKVMG